MFFVIGLLMAVLTVICLGTLTITEEREGSKR